MILMEKVVDDSAKKIAENIAGNILRIRRPAKEETFNTFAVGSTNNVAYLAACEVAKAPAEVHNPLCIYGNSGLGKSHLLHAIEKYVLDYKPEKKVLYISGEAFAEKENLINEKVDVILFDDVQVILENKKLEERFYEIIKSINLSTQQMVIASDVSPKDMKIGNDDVSKLINNKGMIVEIQENDDVVKQIMEKRKSKEEKYVDSFVEFVNSFEAKPLEADKRNNLNKKVEKWFNKHWMVDAYVERMSNVEGLLWIDKKYYKKSFKKLKGIVDCMNEEEYAEYRKYLLDKVNNGGM